jgi:hypothetical protein
MTSYKVATDAGLDFYLSLNHDEGVTYIIVHDLITFQLSMKFFTNIDEAVAFIRTF